MNVETEKIKASLSDIMTWMRNNFMKLNNDKTQISWIGSMKNCNIKYMRDKNFIPSNPYSRSIPGMFVVVFE